MTESSLGKKRQKAQEADEDMEYDPGSEEQLSRSLVDHRKADLLADGQKFEESFACLGGG